MQMRNSIKNPINKKSTPSAFTNCTGYRNWVLSTAMQDITNEITSMNSTKLNPKVSKDISIIADEFPYDLKVLQLLKLMVCI